MQVYTPEDKDMYILRVRQAEAKLLVNKSSKTVIVSQCASSIVIFSPDLNSLTKFTMKIV